MRPGSSIPRPSTSIASPERRREFLSGVLARNIRKCRPGQAQYTIWCDDRGFVVEDGVILRLAGDEFLLTSAEPNLAYFQNLIGYGRVEIEEVTDEVGDSRLPGSAVASDPPALAPEIDDMGYFHLTEAKIGNADGHHLPHRLHRRPRLRDLGRCCRRRRQFGTR